MSRPRRPLAPPAHSRRSALEPRPGNDLGQEDQPRGRGDGAEKQCDGANETVRSRAGTAVQRAALQTQPEPARGPEQQTDQQAEPPVERLEGAPIPQQKRRGRPADEAREQQDHRGLRDSQVRLQQAEWSGCSLQATPPQREPGAQRQPGEQQGQQLQRRVAVGEPTSNFVVAGRVQVLARYSILKIVSAESLESSDCCARTR